ncbi:MAG: cytochrome c maturation protein CcmE [Desulfovibrio sp.]|uniref:cytochrome c maturation protein CcmE n=1 Tax=Desulfovibrio sp. 7SRBS1 TaxID=3378064 RepID=UPI003B3CD723
MGKNKAVYIAAFLLFAAGLGYLVFTGVSQESVYFLNVSEALAMEPAQRSQARLFGMVGPERVERKHGALGVAFDLQDKDNAGEAIRINYAGAVPDTFKPGVEVIVEGRFTHNGNSFSATQLMTKCPSKYEKKKRHPAEV